MIRTAALCLAIISLTGPAVAAELHNGRCHMDYCSWFSIEEKDLVSSNPSGALFKVTTRGWSSHHPNGSYNRRTRRTGGESTASFVFCSKDRPALIFQDESKWVAHTLAPGVQNAVYGYNESAYKRSFVVCHAVAPNDLYAELPRLGKRYGYPQTSPEPDQLDLSTPQEIMTRPTR